MLETFYDLEELGVAIAAVRSVSSLPIVALMSFDSDAVTMGGVHARAAATGWPSSTWRRSGRTTDAARRRRSPRSPRWPGRRHCRLLAALPNVGLATWSGSRVAFPHATPEYFAEFAARARALGAQLIGGCCGTTPAQIAAIRAAIDENRARGRDRGARERALEARRTPTRSRPSWRGCWPPASSWSRCSSTRRSAAAPPG